MNKLTSKGQQPSSTGSSPQCLAFWLHLIKEQKHMILKHVTCNSFPWSKAGDFTTPNLCPNMDK